MSVVAFEPEAVDSLGNTKAVVMTSVTSETAVDLSSDYIIANALDVTLTVDGWDPQINRATLQSRRRLGHKMTFPKEGIAEYQPIQWHYPYDPQGDDEDPNNEAKVELAESLIKYVLIRKGKDALLPLIATDRYELWKVRLGAQTEGQSADDQTGEYEIEQNVYPIALVKKGVIAA